MTSSPATDTLGCTEVRFTRFSNVIAIALALLFVALTSARADEWSERRAWARAALAELSSPDEAVRTKAAAQLAELHGFCGEMVARQGDRLDDSAWAALAEAFVSAKCRSSAAWFVAAAYAAPERHRTRLLDLARKLDPEAGVARRPEEVAKIVDQLLSESSRARCSSGYELSIAILGHDAVTPLLAHLRGGKPESPGDSVACGALSILAEAEDVPAIRDLLVAGKISLGSTLESLQRRGIAAATDALLDAVAAGRIESPVLRALRTAPDRHRVLTVVNAWIAGQDDVTEHRRTLLAELFGKLEAREAVPTMASWIETSTQAGTFTSIANALVRLGDPRGVGLLVRIVSERRTRFPCRPSTPDEEAAARSPGRLCPDGFFTFQRSRAAEVLGGIAGAAVFEFPEGRRRGLRDGESDDDFLDRAAVAFRAWWETAHNKLRFNAETGRWSVAD